MALGNPGLLGVGRVNISQRLAQLMTKMDIPSFSLKIKSGASAVVEKNPPFSVSQKSSICFCCRASAHCKYFASKVASYLCD